MAKALPLYQKLPPSVKSVISSFAALYRFDFAFLNNVIRNKTWPHLDGLRGMAVLIVVSGHYSIFSPYLAVQYASIAKHGVWLFFILSSFLLTHILIRIIERGMKRSDLITYAQRRFLRIYPMYSVALILLLILPQFSKNMFGSPESWSFSKHFFLIYPQGNYWAISAEFEYYLFIPFVSWAFVASMRLGRFVAAALTIFTFAFSYYIFEMINLRWALPPNYPHVILYFNIFLLGSAIAMAHRLYELELFKKPSKLTGGALFFMGTVGIILSIRGIAIEIVAPILGGEGWYHQLASSRGGAITCALMLAGVLWGPEWIQKMFGWAILRFIGIISFSVYLLHILPVAYFQIWVTDYGLVPGLTGLFIITIVLSTVTYIVVERPFMTLSSKDT